MKQTAKEKLYLHRILHCYKVQKDKTKTNIVTCLKCEPGYLI